MFLQAHRKFRTDIVRSCFNLLKTAEACVILNPAVDNDCCLSKRLKALRQAAF